MSIKYTVINYTYSVLHSITDIVNSLTGLECTVQFQHDTEQCLDQLVEYQCTVTGTGFLVLSWRIFDDNGPELGNVIYTSSNDIGFPAIIIGGVFFVQLRNVQFDIIISTISFTVQSSINEYTIVCEDPFFTEYLTINISGMASYIVVQLLLCQVSMYSGSAALLLREEGSGCTTISRSFYSPKTAAQSDSRIP